MREKEKKVAEQLAELEEMKGAQQILNAIGVSEKNLIGKIEGVETKITQKIEGVAKDVIDLKSNQIALVSELLAMNIIKNTPILK
jgi:intein-encoded DNA endonuclease-like protein